MHFSFKKIGSQIYRKRQVIILLSVILMILYVVYCATWQAIEIKVVLHGQEGEGEQVTFIRKKDRGDIIVSHPQDSCGHFKLGPATSEWISPGTFAILVKSRSILRQRNYYLPTLYRWVYNWTPWHYNPVDKREAPSIRGGLSGYGSIAVSPWVKNRSVLIVLFPEDLTEPYCYEVNLSDKEVTNYQFGRNSIFIEIPSIESSPPLAQHPDAATIRKLLQIKSK